MAKVKAIPEGMHTVTSQLTLDGAAQAIEFYKKAFGAQELSRAMDPTGKKVWHASLRIGDSTIFVNDAMPEMGGPGAQPSRLWLYVEDVDGAYKRATQAGAKALMPPTDMFWGDRYGNVTDAWGNEWGIAQHVRDLSPAEMKKAQDAFVAQMAKGRPPEARH
jgi:PhnB protein